MKCVKKEFLELGHCTTFSVWMMCETWQKCLDISHEKIRTFKNRYLELQFHLNFDIMN